MAFLQAIRNFLVPAADRSVKVTEPAPLTEYSVRRLEDKHLDEVLRLNLRCFEDGENYTKHTFAYLLSQPNAYCFHVATSEDIMAGFICVLASQDGTAHITTIGVAPEYRRRGLGERLLANAEMELAEQGICSVVLEVRVGNLSAQSLYKSCGYSVVQRLNSYYNNGEDAFLMVKALA
jgi:[ribosomal protein S18]-alanine N-acetyltransferase